MALYRCVSCGSPNIVTELKKEEKPQKGFFASLFSGKDKEHADNNGEAKRLYRCTSCGKVSESALSDELKSLIDRGVDSLKERENLILRGEKIDWEILKKNFVNIESGKADRELFELEEKKKEEERRKTQELKKQLIEEYKAKGALTDKIAETLADMEIGGVDEEKIAETMEELNRLQNKVDEAKKKHHETRESTIAEMVEKGATREEAERQFAEFEALIEKRTVAMRDFRNTLKADPYISALGELNDSEVSFIAVLVSEDIEKKTIANVMNGIREADEKFLFLDIDEETIIFHARHLDNGECDIRKINDEIYEEVLGLINEENALYTVSDLKKKSNILSEIPSDSILKCMNNLKNMGKVCELKWDIENKTYWHSPNIK